MSTGIYGAEQTICNYRRQKDLLQALHAVRQDLKEGHYLQQQAGQLCHEVTKICNATVDPNIQSQYAAAVDADGLAHRSVHRQR